MILQVKLTWFIVINQEQFWHHNEVKKLKRKNHNRMHAFMPARTLMKLLSYRVVSSQKSVNERISTCATLSVVILMVIIEGEKN